MTPLPFHAAVTFAAMALMIRPIHAAEDIVPLPPDLLGHWTFDSDAASTVGGWSAQGQGGARTGETGAILGTGCYRNTAAEGYLQTDFVVLESNKPQAISLWFKSEATTGADEALFGWGRGGYQAHFDVGFKNGDLYFLVERSSATVPMPVPVNDGSWHHLLISRTASGLDKQSIFLNGKRIGSPTETFGGGFATALRIGTGFQRTLSSGGPAERDFNGSLDDFAYFGSSLSASDAALIHALAKLAGADVSTIQPARILANSPSGAVAMIAGKLWTRATALPGTVGDYGGSMAAGDAWITLDEAAGGIRLAPVDPPHEPNLLALEGVPASVTVRSGDRGTFPFQLRNTGGGPADWTLRVIDPRGEDSSLGDLLARYRRHSPALLLSLPPQVDFLGGVIGSQINSPPFVAGNILKSNLGGPLPYSDGIITTHSAVGTNGRYFTLKLPGLFLFAGDLAGPNLFESSGTLSSTYAVEAHSFDFIHAGRPWKARAVRHTSIFGGVMVNQLFLVDDSSVFPSAAPTYGDQSTNSNVRFSGKRRVIYACFTAAPETNEKWAPFESLARAMTGLHGEVPTGTVTTPATGSSVAGGAASSALQIDALGLLPGSYPLVIDAQPTSGGADPVRSEVMLTIAEPAIRLGRTSIDRAGIERGNAETVSITTASNTGGALPWTARLLDAPTWVSLVQTSGTTPSPISLVFTPPPSGSIGMFHATLEVNSGTNSYLVPISYGVDSFRPTGMVMDPLRNVAYAFNQGNFCGSVVVLSPSRNAVTKVIRLGRGPSDLALSPNGNEIYVLSTVDLEISRVNPVTLERTATRKIAGRPTSPGLGWPTSRIAAGRNGKIYYTDTAPSPRLNLLDFETGEVLATLNPEDLPRVSTSMIAGVADVFYDSHEDSLYFTRKQFSTGYPRIGRIDISDDKLEFIEEWSATTNGSISSFARIQSDLDGKRFFSDQLTFDRAAMAAGRAAFEYPAVDVSAYGHLVLTRYSILDGISGQKLADFPGQAEVAAFTPNQAGVYYHSGFGVFAYWPLPAAIRPPNVAIRPDPPNGGSLEVGEGTLTWSSLPLVEGYRIYLGADQAAVAAAQPGSSSDMGMVTTNAFTMDPVPSTGTFFWRVDALRGDTVVPGTVASFSIASFRVTPNRINVVTPRGSKPQRVILSATDGDGRPVAWSATASVPWIKLPKASGTAGDPLVIELNSTGLAAGSYTSTLRVTGGGRTLEIPVVLEVFVAVIHRLRPDPNRPVAYGLQTGSWNGEPGKMFVIDAATGEYVSTIPLDQYAVDFAIHPHEDRLYVPLANHRRIQVFDLITGAQLPSIQLDETFGDLGSITAGRNGRILLDHRSNSTTSGVTHLIDTVGGKSIAAMPHGYSNSSKGEIVCDPSGTTLYRESGGRIQRIDVSTDVPQLLESGNSTSSISFWDYPNLAVSRDGSRVLSHQTILTADLRYVTSIERDVHAITAGGQVVAGPGGIYWADSGFKAAALPGGIGSNYLDSTRVIFSSDDRFILIWDRENQRVRSHALASILTLPGPNPLPGQQLKTSPEVLSWGAVPGATEYQVFFGSSQAAVNSAGIGSPLRIGTSPTNSIHLTSQPPVGFRYYWRVDALTTGGVVKGAVHFFDLPFQPTADPIVQPGTAVYYSDFGRSVATGPDGLLVGDYARLHWFEFDWSSGSHRFFQDSQIKETFSSTSNTFQTAAGHQLIIAGSSSHPEPAPSSGAVFIHRKAPDGIWDRSNVLPNPPDDSILHFGHRLAYDAGQLLIQEGSAGQISGRVFSYFQWPDWVRGPELIPNPREINDYFGAAIAMDGSRALIGSPGSGASYLRNGSAFIFELDATGRQWIQRARLNPAQGREGDEAGESVALAGRHAALGSGERSNAFITPGVHVFTRNGTAQWLQSGTLIDPASLPGISNSSDFGRAMAVHGDILFVSAPQAIWRGQEGGVVYPYSYNGTGWDVMAPIVPPPGGSQFGVGLAARNGWLFVSQYPRSSSNFKGRILIYRIADLLNQQPQFVTEPPVQIVSGRMVSIEVEAADPDGNDSLVFQPANLPPGLSLEDLGNGRAKITGIPTALPGAELWLRIAVADAQGAEAVQTSRVSVVAPSDMPVIGTLPESLVMKEGEKLTFSPAIAGSGPFSWQWKRDGDSLPNETRPSLVIPNLKLADSGRYTVAVTNVVGTVTSGKIAVSVIPADRFAGDWTSFASGNDRDGYQPASLGRHTFQPVWQTAAIPGNGLNPVAIAAGHVFLTSQPHQETANAFVYDLATGRLIWNQPFPGSQSINSPTWHNGRIYFQRTTVSSVQTWCLDAAAGNPFWNTTFPGSAPNLGTPVADESGIYSVVSNSVVFGYNHSGTQRFRRNLSSSSNPWMPALSDGRLFTWDGSVLYELDPSSGAEIWTINRLKATRIPTTPLIRRSRAYLLEFGATLCVDIDTRRIIWEVARNFNGSAAYGMDRLFVLSGTSILALSPDDGRELARYHTGAPANRALRNHPLILNDHLIASNIEKTFVFDLESGELIQTIPHGGSLAYSAGYLVISGTDNILRAYYANAAPGFAESMPTAISVGAAAGDLILPLGSSAADADPGDVLSWAIVSVSRPGVFGSLEINAQSGDLIIVFNPWESGAANVVVSITDSAGNKAEHTLTLSVPDHPVPQLEVAAALTLNRQSGLYEHAITITNSGAREIAGFDLKIDGLPEGIVVNNASTRDGNDWIILHRQPLVAGAAVNLVIEYYTPIRGTVIDAQVAVEVVTAPEAHPAAPEGGLAVERCVFMADGSVMIEFTSTPGALYEIHYSDDAADWKQSPVRVRAAGNRVQWIDSGPPRTEAPPAVKRSRFYRVKELPQS